MAKWSQKKHKDDITPLNDLSTYNNCELIKKNQRLGNIIKARK